MFIFLALQVCYLLLKSEPILASTGKSPCLHDKLFDFEDPNQKSCFEPVPKSSGSVDLSTDILTVKHGKYSLMWKADTASKLQLKASTFSIPNVWLKRGGVKVWFYKEKASPGKTLEVQYKHSSKLVAKFKANLNFQGWRGIWVKFSECKLKRKSITKRTVIDTVNFVLSDADTIYMDLLGFEKSFGKQSRDKVVPPISPFGLTVYDASNDWQRTYKWSQEPIPESPDTIDETKKESLEHIESRLRNWYCDETKTTSNFTEDSFLKKRWESLLGSIKKAHKEYDRLIFDAEGKVVGPPLFCRDCRYGQYSKADKTRKFGFITETILLPLALEYHLRSRANEVTDAATSQLPELKSGDPDKIKSAYNAIAGEDKNMRTIFKSYLPSLKTLTQSEVETAINTLNLDRLNKINNLLDFLKQQGLADGSGIGSLDHEWNRDGAGFMHTLFLLSDSLRIPSNKSRLLDLISTAKWYNDFGEIYQSPKFELKGTTADRMITLMLYRLMIVLVMPSDDDDEIKAKLRDMEALKRWMENALTVNEGLGGVVKPDFTGFHHKAFYASAYVPQALQTAALVQYLVGGTEFALSESATNNTRRGLETLRLIAVKYSTPNSVNGRFPHYFNKALIKAVLPGYAYSSVSHPSDLPSTIPTGINVSDLNLPQTQMFLRLYTLDDRDTFLNEYLEDGKSSKGKYYPNSLGSLDIMDKVNSTAIAQDISPEPSPEGHWSKNFAVLSVHRREDWAVTVKGFNRFLWDYESSNRENLYGLFASHGALLVANSEAALQVHDVEHGWDWTKVPGATTIAMADKSYDELDMNGKGRFYNQRALAGGLTFKGSRDLENGLFGMDFEQPEYGLKDWRKDIKFEFKKSVFFFENLLVCLGSNIVADHTNGKVVQTTLFQDKLVDGDNSSLIKIDGAEKNYSSTFSAITPPSPGKKYTTLTDTKGNNYYIPDSSRSILKIKVENQISKTDDGKSDTSGHYGTAWFQHDTFPSTYEYAVLIPTTSHDTQLADDTPTTNETAGSEVYKVLQKDATAHVVQFLQSMQPKSDLSYPITGYVMFAAAKSLPSDGPVEAVSEDNCLIMAEETADTIYLSISSPDLNFDTQSGPLTGSDDVGVELLYQSSSKERKIDVILKNPVETTTDHVKVHGTPDGYDAIVKVDDDGKLVRFVNLKNGFSVEVILKKKKQQITSEGI
ncbi:chondroitin sulfate ABC exolyase-like [Oculina patagonica]